MGKIKNKKTIVNTCVILLMAFIAIFFPTSKNYSISDPLYFVFCEIVFLLFLYPVVNERKGFIIGILINLILILYTITNLFIYNKINYGSYPGFLLFSILIAKNYSLLNIERYHIILGLNIISIIIILLGIAVIFDFTYLIDVLLKNYGYGYDELVPFMIGAKKPVATFGSHSIAAFFTFLLFYMNIENYKYNRNVISITNSFFFLILLFFIRSNTAFFFTIISIILLFKYSSYKLKILFLFLFALFLKLLNDIKDSQLPLFFEIFKDIDVVGILSNEGNGFSARYSKISPTQSTINYIINNPFLPLGLCYNPNLYYTDSGFILYMLRGSFFLIFFMYFGVYIFLKNNILNVKYRYFLFL